jgi:hypothetical protein
MPACERGTCVLCISTIVDGPRTRSNTPRPDLRVMVIQGGPRMPGRYTPHPTHEIGVAGTPQQQELGLRHRDGGDDVVQWVKPVCEVRAHV